MRCIWCDHETTTNKSAATDTIRYANKEHIFPEAVGGQRCLSQGLVCQQCNSKLGEVDKFLKTGDFSMMHHYQIVDGIPGKKGTGEKGKARRNRKLDEKISINHHKGGSIMNVGGAVNLYEAAVFSYDEKWSRALHKCLLNSIVDILGIDSLTQPLQLLKNYVITGECGETGWAVGLAYANMFDRYDFEPVCDSLVRDSKGAVIAGVLMFPSLLAVVGCTPDAINKESLWKISRCLYKKYRGQLFSGAGWNPISYFRGAFLSEMSGRKSVHQKMHMILVNKRKLGEPVPGKLQRLACCVYCGQINPTSVEYEKSEVLQQSNHKHSGSKNDWNIYEPQDMALIFDAEHAQNFDHIFQSYQRNGIAVDVKKLDALRATWKVQTICCIACGGYTHAQPKDFFF